MVGNRGEDNTMIKKPKTLAFGVSYPFVFRVIKGQKGMIELIVKKMRRTSIRHKQIAEWRFKLD